MLENLFDVVKITIVQRDATHKEYKLVKSIVDFTQNLDHLSYSIKVMHKPTIYDNIKR
jgi:hypothetical protein